MSAPKFQYSLRTIRPEIPTNFHHERRLPSAPDFTFSRLTSPHLILCDDRELESGNKQVFRAFKQDYDDDYRSSRNCHRNSTRKIEKL